MTTLSAPPPIAPWTPAPRPVPPPLSVDGAPGHPTVVRVVPGVDPRAWAHHHRLDLRRLVARDGALVVRGLGLTDRAVVAAVCRALATTGLLPEREAFAPRTALGGGLHTPTPWPANQAMCHHHELSYVLDTPGFLMTACLTPPARGGAATLADAGAVHRALPRRLVERFEREGWLLTRHHPAQADDVGTSWAEVFGTRDRAAVDRYCRAAAIEPTWLPDGSLRTRQRRPAVVAHPVDGRPCWFNQVAFLSEWTMDVDVREYLIETGGPDALPFSTRFGNGDPIGADLVELINHVYTAHTVRLPWQAGDLLVVDNVRTAHGRDPYDGDREMTVALADAIRPAASPAG